LAAVAFNAAWIKYLPEFILKKLESLHGLQAILAIPMKTAFTNPPLLFDLNQQEFCR
jgi:hypothetical protein